MLILGNLLQQVFADKDTGLITWPWAQFIFALLNLPYLQQVPVGNETPVGLIDGVNATFVLPSEPVDGSLLLVKNSLMLFDGIGYTLNGLVITYQPGYIPNPGDAHRVWYRTLA